MPNCTGCGANYDGSFKFCPYCGQAISGTLEATQLGKWEYIEEIIPLHWSWKTQGSTSIYSISVYGVLWPDDLEKKVKQAILKHIQELGENAWEPSELFDMTSLRKREAFQYQIIKEGFFSSEVELASVTINFKRFSREP